MHPEVFADTYIIPDVLIIEVLDPLITYKLTISSQTTQCLGPEKTDKPLDQFNAFFGVRITSFRQHLKHQGKRKSLINNSNHQYIYIQLSELPIGPVHCKA